MAKKKKKKSELSNKEKIRLKGYDPHYYLEKLGIPIEKCGTNFCDKTDKRYADWMKEREKYGFDSRETWCLEHIFFSWLYERLMMYKEKASEIIDLTYHKFNIGGKEYTQMECIDKMLNLLEYILVSDIDASDLDEEGILLKKKKKVLKIWSKILPAMWW